MTVSTSIASKTYDGDNVTVNFPTEFAFFTAADIEVIERVVATGVETARTLTTDYTVTGGSGSTGTVAAVSAPPDTVTWTIRRVVAEAQGTALPIAGSLPSSAVEQMVDRAVMLVQQHSEELGRSLAFPKTDADTLDPTIPNSVDRASKFLAFDSSGNPIASSGPTGDSSIPVSSFIETLLDDASDTVARATLGVEIGVDVEAVDADILRADTADTLAAGFDVTPNDAGTQSSGTLTPAFATRNVYNYVNGGAHTLAPPPSGSGSIVLQMTNNASAGAVTISGFTTVTGDSLTTTDGDDFLFFVTRVGSFSQLHVVALQ
ncbi:MAG: hypothetical protein GKS00_21900 [Alphaproteobacteria bacterium]|nr:hypothetical protein [Alphaproteobacteria bacterium]